MADKKQSARATRGGADKNKPGAQVSTGAWWKSAEVEDKAQAAAQAASSQPDSEAAAQPAPQARPARRTKRQSQDAQDAGPSPEKTRPRRAGRRKRNAEPSADTAADTPETAPDVVISAATSGAEEGTAAGGVDRAEERLAVSEEAARDQQPAPKKSSRRRRRGKKSASVEANGAEPNAESGAAEAPTGEDDATDVSASAPIAVGEAGLAAAFRHDPDAVYKLLINAEEPEECRVALLVNGRLESLHVSNVERAAMKNNIYKGRVISVEANLQVAFVDIGAGRNAFLPFNEIHPEYYREDIDDSVRELIAQRQWKKIKIEEVMARGQEVLVQVVKEVTGNKGAGVTTYLSLPGRCLVLLPGSDSAGVSRKIVGDARRNELRAMMGELDLPEGLGYIVRTAGADISLDILKEDLERLLALWTRIRERGRTASTPALIYQERDTVERFLRDHFFPEIQEIVVDTEETLQEVRDFVRHLPEDQRKVRVRRHLANRPIFNLHNVEEQIESIYRPQVPLPSGGSIVIDPTEALVAVDVNSGRTSKNDDFDETVFQTNMEAAEELARQLRLRDLGGLIVVDFIDMRNKTHIREVEQQIRSCLKRDKARTEVGRISRFGLLQLSRQKMGAPTAKGTYVPCPHCRGRGVVRSVETLALFYLRRIQTGIVRKKVARVECRFPLAVAQYLLNRKKEDLVDLERRHNAVIDIIVRPDMRPADNEIIFHGPAAQPA